MTTTTARPRSHWGWGYEDDRPSHEERRAAAAGLAAAVGFGATEPERPVPVAEAVLPPVALDPPATLREICSTDHRDRATHAYGQALRDVVRALRGRFDHAPDVVARPRDEREVEEVLAWCEHANAAAIPFGGGTSVVGGVEARVPSRFDGAVAIDLGRLDRVLEVDPVSRAARIQAGASGPRLERQLAPHGLTLRFFPQSFELSTLGGWIATRAGGHFATGPTHIEDLVESVRAITPAGTWASRRLPGSGAGPSPDRLLAGSEGTLGVITEAWVRVLPRPVHRRSASVAFPGFLAGAQAVRALAQSGLAPANCRLLDPREAALTGAHPGDEALLLVGFESADHPLDAWIDRALELCREHGGRVVGERTSEGERPAAEEGWREAFLRAPHLRDTFVTMGILAETLETAITWDRFAAFHDAVIGAVEDAVRDVCGDGRVTCRITHAYPDGASLYVTVLAPARRGSEVAQWDAIKRAASGAIEAGGGTITHHHAVGRDHRPWYDRQRPDPFAAALRAARAAVDPRGLMNPGVLVGGP